MEAYNLKIVFKQNSDRSNPLCFPVRANVALTKTSGCFDRRKVASCDDSLCVPLGCHHIISFSQLREYWNAHLDAGHLEYSCKFLSSMGRSLGEYNIKDADVLKEAKECCEILQSRKVIHKDSAPSLHEKDSFVEVFGYMPGNIFIGPSGSRVPYCRVDDPENKFEKDAWVITGDNAFKMLFELDMLIKEYLYEPSAPLASRIGNGLVSVSQRTDYYKLKPECWLYKKGHFRILVPASETPVGAGSVSIAQGKRLKGSRGKGKRDALSDMRLSFGQSISSDSSASSSPSGSSAASSPHSPQLSATSKKRISSKGAFGRTYE